MLVPGNKTQVSLFVQRISGKSENCYDLFSKCESFNRKFWEQSLTERIFSEGGFRDFVTINLFPVRYRQPENAVLFAGKIP